MASPGEGIPPAIDPTDQAGQAIDPACRFDGSFTPESVEDLQQTMQRVADGVKSGIQSPVDLAALDRLSACVRSEEVYVPESNDQTAQPDADEILYVPQTSYTRTITDGKGNKVVEEIDPEIGKALDDYKSARLAKDLHTAWSQPGAGSGARGQTDPRPGRPVKPHKPAVTPSPIGSAAKGGRPSAAATPAASSPGSGKPAPRGSGAETQAPGKAEHKEAAKVAPKRGKGRTGPDSSEPIQASPTPPEQRKTPETRKLNHPLRSVVAQRAPRGEDVVTEERGLYAVFGAVSQAKNAQKATRSAEKAIRDYYAVEAEPPKSPADAAARMKAAFIQAQEALPRDGSGGVASATVAKVEHIEGKDYLITGSIGNSPIMLWRNGQLTPIGEVQDNGEYMTDGLGHPHHKDGKEGGFHSVELQPGDMVLLASGGTLSNNPDHVAARGRDLSAQLQREYGDVFTTAALGNGTDAKPAERAVELCCTLGKAGADKSAILLQYGEVMKPRPLDVRSGEGRTFLRIRESFNRTDYTHLAFSGADDARGIYSAYNVRKIPQVSSQRSPAKAAQQRARLFLENQPQPRDLEQAVNQMHDAMAHSSEATDLYGNRNDAEGVLTRIVEVNGEPYLVAARAGDGMAAVYRDGRLADAFEGVDLVSHVNREGHEIAVRKLERGDKILIASAGIFGNGDVPRDDAATRAYSLNNVSIRDILGAEDDPRVAAQRFLDEYGQAGRNAQTGAQGRNFREKVAIVIQVGQPDPFARERERLDPVGPGIYDPLERGPGLLQPAQVAEQQASLRLGGEALGEYIEYDEAVALKGLGRAVHWLQDRRSRQAEKKANYRGPHASVLPGATPNRKKR
ncbi:hypothetical protein IPL68_02990 [Candidatus Saccharibacteria bacterium]|nr:MAG: hypothetical protein IPL68_02990 [Candidatus Saccharibacteria bacterium]